MSRTEREQQFSPTIVEVAWDAVEIAASSHDELQSLNGQIDSWTEPTAQESDPVKELRELQQDRDETQKRFDDACSIAAVVYGRRMEDSFGGPAPERSLTPIEAIQRLGELGVRESITSQLGEIINYGSRMRPIDELKAFADLFKYGDGMGVRTRNTLMRIAREMGTLMQVPMLEAYYSAPDQPLHVVKVTDTGEEYFDIDGLYNSYVTWMTEGVPELPGASLGRSGLNLIAEYLNHARPSADEPLPVEFPHSPATQETKDVSDMSQEELRELLLDTVEVDGKNMSFVTSNSIRRFGMTILGYKSSKLPHVKMLMNDLATRILGATPPHKASGTPIRVTFDAYSLERRMPGNSDMQETTLWGVTTSGFVRAMREVEASANPHHALDRYAGLTREVVRQYLTTLGESGLLPSEDVL